jgi:uncharacterized membrane protein YkvA (DUF1232 family)
MNDLLRMLSAMVSRRYKVIPWRSLALLVFVLIYGVDPIDLIPDFIPIVGLLDDLAAGGLLIWSIRSDLRKFLEWERMQSAPQPNREIVDAEFTEVKEEPRQQ